MREAILKIAAEHRRAVGQPLAGPPLARFIRRAWPVRPAVTAPIPEPIPHQEDRHG